jgi:hypothetical protein
VPRRDVSTVAAGTPADRPVVVLKPL